MRTISREANDEFLLMHINLMLPPAVQRIIDRLSTRDRNYYFADFLDDYFCYTAHHYTCCMVKCLACNALSALATVYVSLYD